MKILQDLTTLSNVTNHPKFNKAQKGKWYQYERVYAIKSSSGSFGLVSLNSFERLGKFCNINPFKKSFGKSVTPISSKELKNLDKKISNTSQIITPSNRVSPAIQSLIDYMADKEQAKLLITVSKDNPKGSDSYEVIFRKADKSRLDKAFITSYLTKRLGNQDLTQLSSDHLSYHLFTKTIDGQFFDAYRKPSGLESSGTTSRDRIPDLNEKGDFVMKQLTHEQIMNSF